MEFSEAREWRTLFVHGPRHTQPVRGDVNCGSRPLQQRRSRLVDPEIDAHLLTVDELLALSPERCAQSPDGVRRWQSATPAVPQLLSGGATSSSAAPAPAPTNVGPQAANRRPASPAAVALAAAPSPDANSTASVAKGDSTAKGQAEVQQPRSHGSYPFFVRRPPENYARLDTMESALTMRVRQQASHDDGPVGSSGSASFSFAAAQVAGMALGQVDGSRMVEVRLYLPPYGSKSAVTMNVPMGMRVADLRDEVIRQHAGRDTLDPCNAYELRLYDEDEEEPDYDCPPFDEHLQVGLLNVREVAVCAMGSQSSSTPPSPPLSSPREEGSFEQAHIVTTPEPATIGDDALHRTLNNVNADTLVSAYPPDRVDRACSRRSYEVSRLYPLQEEILSSSFDRNGERSADSGKRISPNDNTRSDITLYNADDARSATPVGSIIEEPTRLEGTASINIGYPHETVPNKTSVVHIADSCHFRQLSDPEDDRGPHRVFSHRRTRSSPQCPANPVVNMSPAQSVTSVGTVDPPVSQANDKNGIASKESGFSARMTRSPFKVSQTPDASLLRKVSDSEVERAPNHSFSHRRTRSSPQEKLYAGGALVTFGGFEALTATPVSSSTAGNASVADTPAADGEMSAGGNAARTRRLEVLLADGHGQPDVSVSAGTARGTIPWPATMCSGGTGTDSDLSIDRRCTDYTTNAGATTPGGAIGAASAAGEVVVLDVREDATLYEALEQLLQEHGRPYDRVNLALERCDDGIQQKLDLDMQVRHLPSNPGVLTMVRKDTPMMAFPSAPGTPATRRMESLSLLSPSRPWQHDATIRRPPPSAFFFNEYTASVATEYLVTVAARGSRARPAECSLVVDRERLYHRVPRGASQAEDEERRRSALTRGSFMSPLLRKLGKHLQQTANAEANCFAERRVCDVRSVWTDERHQRAFLVTYACSSTGGGGGTAGTAELVYEAQTPTECAEIVARLQFLQTLVL